MKVKRWTCLVLACGLIAQANSKDLYATTIPVGTPVSVKLTDKVSSATHKKGDRVAFQVASDVRIGDTVVIASGTPAEGEVLNASKRFIAGVGGQLDIDIQRTRAVDGSMVPLQSEQGAHGGSRLISVICGVFCLCFFFIPGKNVEIEKDTVFAARVTSPVDVKLPSQ